MRCHVPGIATCKAQQPDRALSGRHRGFSVTDAPLKFQLLKLAVGDQFNDGISTCNASAHHPEATYTSSAIMTKGNTPDIVARHAHSLSNGISTKGPVDAHDRSPSSSPASS